MHPYPDLIPFYDSDTSLGSLYADDGGLYPHHSSSIRGGGGYEDAGEGKTMMRPKGQLERVMTAR
jgi:hypothetical protein